MFKSRGTRTENALLVDVDSGVGPKSSCRKFQKIGNENALVSGRNPCWWSGRLGG